MSASDPDEAKSSPKDQVRVFISYRDYRGATGASIKPGNRALQRLINILEALPNVVAVTDEGIEKGERQQWHAQVAHRIGTCHFFLLLNTGDIYEDNPLHPLRESIRLEVNCAKDLAEKGLIGIAEVVCSAKTKPCFDGLRINAHKGFRTYASDLIHFIFKPVKVTVRVRPWITEPATLGIAALAAIFCVLLVFAISRLGSMGVLPSSFSFVPVQNLATGTNRGDVPPGTIIAWAGSDLNPPEGWLVCNGSWISRDDPKFKTLIAELTRGEHGWVESNRLVQIPDLRGMFLRGLDKDPSSKTPRNIDSQSLRLLGQTQGVRFPDHAHRIPVLTGDLTNALAAFTWDANHLYFGKLRAGDSWISEKSRALTAIVTSHQSNDTRDSNRVDGVDVRGRIIIREAKTESVETNVIGELNPVNVAVRFLIKL